MVKIDTRIDFRISFEAFNSRSRKSFIWVAGRTRSKSIRLTRFHSFGAQLVPSLFQWSESPSHTWRRMEKRTKQIRMDGENSNFPIRRHREEGGKFPALKWNSNNNLKSQMQVSGNDWGRSMERRETSQRNWRIHLPSLTDFLLSARSLKSLLSVSPLFLAHV